MSTPRSDNIADDTAIILKPSYVPDPHRIVVYAETYRQKATLSLDGGWTLYQPDGGVVSGVGPCEAINHMAHEVPAFTLASVLTMMHDDPRVSYCGPAPSTKLREELRSTVNWDEFFPPPNCTDRRIGDTQRVTMTCDGSMWQVDSMHGQRSLSELEALGLGVIAGVVATLLLVGVWFFSRQP